jgi:S1-C subfamily serine protease
LLKDLGASLSDSHIGVSLLGDIIMRLPIYRELWSRALRLASLVLMASSLSAVAQTQKVLPTDRGQVQLSFAPVVKSVTPAVVNVYASRVERQARNPLFDDPVFRRFFKVPGLPETQTQNSLGSGVIATPEGLILTNNHVLITYY